MGFVGGKNSTFFCSPFKVIFFNISFQFLSSVGKIQALLVFCLGYAFGKNQMCLNVRLAFYNEAQRSSVDFVWELPPALSSLESKVSKSEEPCKRNQP